MRIVAISDLHLDVVTSGVPRFGEVEAALSRAVDHAIEHLDPREGDFFACLGDVCDPDCGPVGFRVAAALIAASSAAILDWAAGGGRQSLPALVARAFDAVAAG